jgi:superfamily II DNA/RNA helicase
MRCAAHGRSGAPHAHAHAQAIPTVLARQDTLIQAPTGTGKTLAFVLPMLQTALRHPSTPFQTMLIVPSRELGNQVRPLYTAV